MSYKTIEVLVENKHINSIDKISNKSEVINTWKIKNQDGCIKYSMIIEEKNVEMFIDLISKILDFDKEIKNIKDIKNIIILNPVEGF